MASFCTSCGAPLAADVQFCMACGARAPVGAVGPGQAAPVFAQPASQEAGSAVKIVLIVVGVFVGLAMLSAILFAFGVWRVSRSMHMKHAGGGVILSTPGGSITTGPGSTVSDADLGVPVYPGASRRDGGMEIHSANGSMTTSVYTTTDPPGKVLDFYKNKLGANASVIETGHGGILTAGERNQESWMITVDADASDGGKTKIAIMHGKKS
ncbi:MAG TPA: zinc ribbon domain-containing protein [Acidobacteriaceae bacterium]|nr:zinc ribbon domain-containing protein [Acidobacteriaceae bacterium]